MMALKRAKGMVSVDDAVNGDGPAAERRAVSVETALLIGARPADFRSPSAATVPELRGVRVVVVDDDDDSRDLVVSILQRCEAITFAASSAEEALCLLVKECPDLLVSDIGMPGMDGFELVRAVRALPDERVRGVPAVAVTAFVREEDQRRALAEGFQLHIAKPIEPGAFARAVAGLSQRRAAATV